LQCPIAALPAYAVSGLYRPFVRRVSLFSNTWDSVLGELLWAHVTSAVKFSVESVETVGLLGRLKPKRYGYVFFPSDDKD
jgi:hypothetical protein